MGRINLFALHWPLHHRHVTVPGDPAHTKDPVTFTPMLRSELCTATI